MQTITWEEQIMNNSTQSCEKHTNICADCAYPITDCPWLRSGQAVDGWDADQIEWRGSAGVKTYFIKKCPLFVKPPPRQVFNEYISDEVRVRIQKRLKACKKRTYIG